MIYKLLNNYNKAFSWILSLLVVSSSWWRGSCWSGSCNVLSDTCSNVPWWRCHFTNNWPIRGHFCHWWDSWHGRSGRVHCGWSSWSWCPSWFIRFWGLVDSWTIVVSRPVELWSEQSTSSPENTVTIAITATNYGKRYIKCSSTYWFCDCCWDKDNKKCGHQ